jgi:hypothetical protein
MFYLAFGLMAIADKRMEVCINIAKYCVWNIVCKLTIRKHDDRA